MIHVAVATDAAYVPYCAVAVQSVLDAPRRQPVTAHVLVGADVGADDRAALAGLASAGDASVVVHQVDTDALLGLPGAGRFGPSVWYRMLLPEILEDERRVLYLDADTLVVDALDDVWVTELSGAPLAAVHNVVHPELFGRANELGLTDMRQYFNSGVLLFDLDALRADRLLERALTTARQAGDRFAWPDQDALNVTFAGRWLPLHPRWNCMNSLRLWRAWADDAFGAQAVEEALASPAVVHFEGPALNKPWHYLSSHPLTARYRSVLARTPWAATPLEGRTFVNRVLAILPDRWRRPLYVRARRLDAGARELA